MKKYTSRKYNLALSSWYFSTLLQWSRLKELLEVAQAKMKSFFDAKRTEKEFYDRGLSIFETAAL